MNYESKARRDENNSTRICSQLTLLTPFWLKSLGLSKSVWQKKGLPRFSERKFRNDLENDAFSC